MKIKRVYLGYTLTLITYGPLENMPFDKFMIHVCSEGTSYELSKWIKGTYDFY